ncbi:hypothetical protein A7U61_11755 [Lactococcus lactis]|nr:hypothetical protein [Lactococcus lactis]OAJ96555.1 hypothetical protein A7U61_11755 [Lactococcus lactis]
MSYTNWVSLIVGLLALGGVIFGAFYKTWQDKKNIKMQARIQWIQEVRNHTAELLSRGYADKNTGYYFKKEIETVCLFFTTNESETSAIPNSDEFEICLEEINKLEKENEKSDKNKNKHTYIIQLAQNLKKYSDNQEYLDKYLPKFREVISTYLKHEWDRANNGK